MKKLITCLLFLVVASQTYAQEKVAVVVSAGDLGQLEDAMKTLEKQATKVYTDLGYKVILLGGTANKGANLSPDVLKSTLKNLDNVKDLRLDFIGHGILLPIPPEKQTGEPIKLSSERRANGFQVLNSDKGFLTWYASNSSTGDNAYYGYKAKLFGFAPDSMKPVSHTDVKAALEGFREKNPDGVTTINLLNCFSGAVAQDFRSMPQTIVFGNSPANQPALELSEYLEASFSGGEGFIRPNDGLGYFYDALGVSNNKPLTLLDARQFANRKMTGHLKDSPNASYLVGRSPMFESALGWCEAGYPGKISANSSDPTIWPDSPKKSMGIRLDMEMSQIKSFFDYSSAMPTSWEPRTKITENWKFQYEQCINPSETERTSAKQELERTKKEYDEWQSMRKLYVSDPTLPIRLQMDRYLKVLNDPKKQEEIFKKVQSSVENDLNNLKRQNLPRERWGAITQFIDGMKDGSITKEKVIGDLRKAVEELKTKCNTSSSFPCSDFWGQNQTFYQFLEFSPMVKDNGQFKDAGCPRTSKYFECIMQKYPGNYEFLLEKYWGQKEDPQNQDPTKSCNYLEWPEYQKTKANIQLDENCIKAFLTSAPEQEWENLERLLKLGQRDARGREPAAPPAVKSPSGGAR